VIDPTAGVQATLAARPADPDVASDQSIEKLFATMVLKEVRKTMPKDGMMGDSAGVDAFFDMFDEHLAEQIAASGSLNLEGDGVPRSHAAMRYQAVAAAGGPNRSLPVQGAISSGFGSRIDPIHGGRRQHDGMDIAASHGAPVFAASAGRVTFAGSRGGYGNLVVLVGDDGVETRYAHLSRVDVREGDMVGTRDALGAVGDTGRATGPHLHIEVRREGVAVDPAPHFGWDEP